MGSNLIKITEILQCLETLSESAQNEIKDKLMVTSSDEWHDICQLHTYVDNHIVDTDCDDYIHVNDLETHGYVHKG